MESYMFDDASSSIDEQESIENKHPTENYPIRNPRRLDSAEKYFDWASKTNRKLINDIQYLFSIYSHIGPMEYLRGKRFWLFTKKDEHAHNHETNPNTGTSPGSFGQGIWRSGIVGRRRRR